MDDVPSPARTTVVNINARPRPVYDVYIGRAGYGEKGTFGNPFRMRNDTPALRRASIIAYAEWFLQLVENDHVFRSNVEALRGKVLGCFCAPKLCHGHVIAEWLDTGAVLKCLQDTSP